MTDRPSDRPSAPQAYQCLLSHFLATLGAQEEADCTSMLSSIDSCQNRVSADRYHLTVSTHQDGVFFWSYPLTILFVFKWLQAQVYFFLKFTSNMLCLCQYQYFLNTGGEDLFLPWSCVGHAPRLIFMVWLVKIWQVSSWVKFMQLLESCLLWQLKLTEFWVNLWCF